MGTIQVPFIRVDERESDKHVTLIDVDNRIFRYEIILHGTALIRKDGELYTGHFLYHPDNLAAVTEFIVIPDIEYAAVSFGNCGQGIDYAGVS
jgi:hypothetical protein